MYARMGYVGLLSAAAVLLVGGAGVFAMKQVEAASGTKYSDGSIVWWSKGNEGFLEDDTKADQSVRLAENCKLERARSGTADSGVVSGTVAYRERMAMPENALLTIQLQDVSVADSPAKVIAEQRFMFAGHQVPLPFEVHYDSAKIDPKHSYALSARITVDGQLMFLNTTTYRVITQSNPVNPDLLLVTAFVSHPKAGMPTDAKTGFGSAAFLYELKSRRRVVVTPTNVFVQDAEWSRDGIQIFFTNREKAPVICRIFWDGSGYKRVRGGTGLVVGQ